MKNLFLVLVLISSVSYGSQGRGGGSRVAGAFRLRAYEIIKRISLNPNAEMLCASSVMIQALGNSEVRVVPDLIDLVTKLSVNDPRLKKPSEFLDAWSMPGDIQLLNTWKDFVDAEKSKEGDSVDLLVLHEIYRSTGNVCLDERNLRSTQVISLLSVPLRHSKIYKFNHLVQDVRTIARGSLRPQSRQVCDLELKSINVGKVATCLYLATEMYFTGSGLSQETHYFVRVVMGKYKIENENHWFYVDELKFKALDQLYGSSPLSNADHQSIGNLLNYFSEAPFYLVLDMDSGTAALGYNLQNLQIIIH